MAIKREKQIDSEIRKKICHKILGNNNQEQRIRIYRNIANKTGLFYFKLKRGYF
jgi:hypothetical protein